MAEGTKNLSLKEQLESVKQREKADREEAERSYALMQQLIEEMDRSNQRITEMEQKMEKSGGANRGTGQYEGLYDEAWKSEESDAASLQDVPLTEVTNDSEAGGYDDAVNSAIAEVSKDFLTGLRPPAKHNDSEESQLSSDTDFKLVSGMAYCVRYPETGTGLSDTDWNPYGTESDNNVSPRLQDSSSQHLSDSKVSWNPPLHSTDVNAVTPFSIYSRAASIHESRDRTDGTKPDVTADFSTISHVSEFVLSPVKNNKDVGGYVPPELNKTMRAETNTKDSLKTGAEYSQRHSAPHEVKTLSSRISSENSRVSSGTSQGMESSHYVSVVERAKLLGIPQDILEGKKSDFQGEFEELSPDTTTSQGYASEDDHLGQKVERVLSRTEHLDKKSRSGVDYSTLQRDLQEIQDSLYTLGSGTTAASHDGSGRKKSPATSDSDIIPSTTTTPERQRRGHVNLAAMGYSNAEGILRDLSFNSFGQGNQKSPKDQHGFNSDGEETHTSGSSSSKHDNHAAADQVLADMSEILQPLSSGLHTGTDVDQMLSNFRDQRRQLETRYQQLNNQGLAEKVYRILSHQDPNSQANGILSEVSAEEKDMKTRYAMNLGWKDFNLSANSKPGVDESQDSFAMKDDVCKHLDFSDLSSVDSSRVLAKSSFNMPSKKGFTAFEDMTNFLSTQMAKASELSFNHSIEMRLPPQHIQCYPLLADRNSNAGGDHKEDEANEKKDEDTAVEETERKRDALDRNEAASSSAQREFRTESPNSDHDNKGGSSPDSQASLNAASKERYRPYRPAGCKEVYYTESDTASVADSVTTMESTHIGSDDARGPYLPPSVLGSRKDNPNTPGIYSSKKQQQGIAELPTIQERSSIGEDRDSESLRGRDTTPNVGTRSEGEGVESSINEGIAIRVRAEVDELGKRSSPSGKCSVEGARREARWENRAEETGRDRGSPELERINSATTQKKEQTSYADQPAFSSREYQLGSSSRRGEYTTSPIRGSVGSGYDRGTRPTYSLPADAFVSSREESKFSKDRENDEPEPLSLRIKMTYEEEDNEAEENTTSKMPQEKGMRGERVKDDDRRNRDELRDRLRYSDSGVLEERTRRRSQSPVLRVRSPSPELPRYSDILSDRREREQARDSMRYRARDEDTRYRTRETTSPIRDARLSPAFHRALSPELRTAIESRSPLLSQQIERSLAQPPAYQDRDEQRSRRDGPPTFLAREHRRFHSPESLRRQDYLSSVDSQSVHGAPIQREEYQRERSPAQRYSSHMRRDEREFERQVLGGSSRDVRATTDTPQQQERSRSPVPKRFVELTMENMSSDSEVDKEVDSQPVSKRLQLLTHALTEEERGESLTDINKAWEEYKACNESEDSSMSSGRMDAVSELLKNPAHHQVHHYLQEREQYLLERRDRAERDKLRQQQEQQILQQLSHSTTTEDDPSTIVVPTRQEFDKQRKRSKKKGRSTTRQALKNQQDVENVPDRLFSIAEDSFEQSPNKVGGSSASKRSKSGSQQEQNVIDPHMRKLRERIHQQRHKIDKGKLKELQRVERVRRLEELLTLKKEGEIGDGTLQKELENISNTSSPSQESALESTPLSDDSTTAKDSSTEMHRWKAEKERRIKESKRIIAEKQQQERASQMNTKDAKNQELRLLRLVKDGQLSPEEAYILAVGQANKSQTKETEPSNKWQYPESNSSWEEEKPHQRFKPYLRPKEDAYQRTRHAPKLCLPQDMTNNNRVMNEFRSVSQSSNNVSKSFTRASKGAYKPNDHWQVGSFYSSNGYKRLKETSSSPPRRPRVYGTSPAPQRSPSRRTQSASPHRKSQLSNVRQGRQQSSRSRDRKSDLGLDTPVRESVAWHIQFDAHPTQWKEPTSKGQDFSTNQNLESEGWPIKERQGKTTGTLIVEDLEDEQEEKQKANIHQAWLKGNKGIEIDDSFYTSQKSDAVDPHKSKKHSFFDLRKKGCPEGIPREEWIKVLSKEELASKENHWEVDPLKDRVQYILNKPLPGERVQSLRPVDEPRQPLHTMSLQEAFLSRKQTCISHLKERQKRIALSKDNRHMQECLRVEREAIFMDPPKIMHPNLYAHPYSDNLYQPKNRILTKQEMKEMSKKKYENLPEVLQKKEKEVKKQESKLNRLRAKLFNKKVQQDVLRKCPMRRR